MTSVWSHRPPFWQFGLFFAAYVLGCAFARALQIVPGSTISFWPPGGLFMATLIWTPVRSWPWWALSSCLAEMFAQFVWFNSPLPVGLLVFIANALEAVGGACLVNRAIGRPVRLETVQEVLKFVVLGAGVAPIVGATVGSATLAWFGVKSQTFTAAWPLFWIGDATGILIVAPLTLILFQHWSGKPQLAPRQWIEVFVLGLIFVAVAALTLSGQLPFAYLIMPPLLWAAVRFDFKGAAVALIILAVIVTVFTAFGVSEFIGDAETQRQKQIMLHLFLAISAFSALIVAAISRQHQLTLLTLRHSVDALRERERELSQVVDMIPSHVWRLGPDGEPIFFNKRMVDFIGLDVADCGKPGRSGLDAIIEAVHSDDAAKFGDTLKRCLVTGQTFVLRYRLRRADGIYHWMSSRADPLRDHEGRIVQWYGLCHDIDDQMRADEALRQSERELSQLVNMLPVHIRRLTAEGETTFFNQRTADYIGMDLGELNKRGMSALAEMIQGLIHPDDAARLQQTTLRSLATGESYAMRYRVRRADGVYRWMEGRGEPVRDRNGSIVQWYGISIDIDDEVRAQEAEEALRQASAKLSEATKAASLAQLSASIAHEVNQPLAAIMFNSHACQRWLSAEPPNLERAKITIERIVRDANSAADVVSRIRALFRQSVEPRTTATLPNVVAEVCTLMAEEAAGQRVRMDVDVEHDLPLVKFDQVQIQQVLINLLRNGMDAMDSVTGDRILQMRIRRAGETVQTEIRDCGSGVEIPEKIFEPFFTTKKHGMGMGLAICRSIVESHSGRLWAEKNEPQGAAFIFTLPVEMKTMQ